MSFRSLILCFLTAFAFGGSALGAERFDSSSEWMRGALAVGAARGEVVVEEIGGVTIAGAEVELPQYLSGQIRVRAADRSDVFLRTSNGMALQNRGRGFFAIERFEQIAGDLDPETPTLSRMILSLRNGLLVVDSRGMSDDSHVILESPLGRISVRKALWLIQIAFDERSGVYSFTIECAEGNLRFTDRREDHYTLSVGRRLSGAGGAHSPSIEVGEVSGEARDLFANFQALSEAFALADISKEALAAKMEPLQRGGHAPHPEASDSSESGLNLGDKRPLLIEYAPRSAPLKPFRGVISAPSQFEADRF